MYTYMNADKSALSQGLTMCFTYVNHDDDRQICLRIMLLLLLLLTGLINRQDVVFDCRESLEVLAADSVGR